MKSNKIVGKFSSTAPISFEHRFNISPAKKYHTFHVNNIIF